MEQDLHKKLVSFAKYNKTVLALYRGCGNLLGVLLKATNKTKPKRVLFMSFGGQKYDDSPKALYERMKEDPFFRDYELIWGFTHPERFPNVAGKKVKVDTLPFYITAVSAGIWITNSSVERGLHLKKRDCIEINTWHGTPLKKAGEDVKNDQSFGSTASFSDVPVTYCAQSDYNLKIFEKYFHTTKEHILLCDLPRNDALLCYTPERIAAVRKRLHIPEEKKVILYAPTFREFTRDKFNACCLKPPIDTEKWRKALGEEYIVLFRAHYEVIHVLGIEDSDFIRNVSNDPCLNDLYAVSDLLISDYSSVFVDYSITGKPMFCFAYDYDEYVEKRGLYLDLEKDLPCRVNRNEDQLLDELLHYDRKAYCAGTRAFQERFAPWAGHATEAVVEALKGLIEQNR